ncbi:MAG: hypothetical protein ABL896_19315, partial [Hylemonella sp.]
MSDSSSNFSFPHRTPVFTALIVIFCFASFYLLARRIYRPQASVVQTVEGVRTPDDRRKLLAEHRTKEQAGSAGYAWIDQQAGT